MPQPSIDQMLKALDDAMPLERMMVAFPVEWRAVDDVLNRLFATGDPSAINAFMTKTRAEMDLWQEKIRDHPHQSALLAEGLSHLLQGRMAFESLNIRLHALLGGKDSRPGAGLSRYNLFFARKLLRLPAVRRLPPPGFWMRFCWRFVTQKGGLLSLLEQSGIYAIFTVEFVVALARIMRGSGTLLEVGAGDGTLSKFLKREGLDIVATDDYSWTHKIRYGEGVLKMGASEALSQFAPSCVVCSWPPPGNDFEKIIFATRSVMTYIVIGSRHPFATSNRDAYIEAAGLFERQDAPHLARALFPPELDHEVLIFRRKYMGSVPNGAKLNNY